MAWNVEIKLRESRDVLIQDLKSINTQSSSDSSITSLTDFEKFHLIQNQRLSFLSENQIFSIDSSDILSVLFRKV
ncbi:hypothetical protein I6G82_02705 [Lysinibacillus macroides]|uniref:Uncharacterized protein n=1 Tax=Lysinibacillus macroides TaxID=33935 RepID=A0A0N0UWH8_9BACI|nr:hypothetical protein [Lysinibacillus macroides]KOY81277.1 hypothetical protein ADM90_19270 [Lysinibacillus macroides]QPR68561.1 hypothetical protein I6G82_02705 [Lysinibacillus macroides]